MIRNLEINDLEEVMHIWLQTNIEAHHFITNDYWQNNYAFVKEILPKSDVKVYEEDGIIKGFIGLVDDYIGGLFVSKKYQGQGVGTQLLASCKDIKNRLLLDAYMENEQAVNFYKANGFEILTEKNNEDTKRREFSMVWVK